MVTYNCGKKLSSSAFTGRRIFFSKPLPFANIKLKEKWAAGPRSCAIRTIPPFNTALLHFATTDFSLLFIVAVRAPEEKKKSAAATRDQPHVMLQRLLLTLSKSIKRSPFSYPAFKVDACHFTADKRFTVHSRLLITSAITTALIIIPVMHRHQCQHAQAGGGRGEAGLNSRLTHLVSSFTTFPLSRSSVLTAATMTSPPPQLHCHPHLYCCRSPLRCRDRGRRRAFFQRIRSRGGGDEPIVGGAFGGLLNHIGRNRKLPHTHTLTLTILA